MNKLGFGFLHLPMTAQNDVDYSQLIPMVDAFLAAGGTYFDTAYTYLNGKSEIALREALIKRHPRNFDRITKSPGILMMDGRSNQLTSIWYRTMEKHLIA